MTPTTTTLPKASPGLKVGTITGPLGHTASSLGHSVTHLVPLAFLELLPLLLVLAVAALYFYMRSKLRRPAVQGVVVQPVRAGWSPVDELFNEEGPPLR